MRGIYSAGILDTFLLHQFNPFDLCIGVSAGASNAAAYLGNKRGRNHYIYTDYCRRPEFKSFWHFLRGGHLIDIDWLWQITEKELPIGLDTIFSANTEFLATVTCANTAETQYLAPRRDTLFQLLKASGNMPFAFRNKVMHEGKQWFDGGVSDSLPVHEAYRRGARKILVLRSNPASYQKQSYRINKLFPLLLRPYPSIARALQQRHIAYNHSLSFIRNPPGDCEIIEICPDESFAAGQFTMDLETLEQAYQLGEKDGYVAIRRWQAGD